MKERLKVGSAEECEKEQPLQEELVDVLCEALSVWLPKFVLRSKERKWLRLSSKLLIQFVLWCSERSSFKKYIIIEQEVDLLL